MAGAILCQVCRSKTRTTKNTLELRQTKNGQLRGVKNAGGVGCKNKRSNLQSRCGAHLTRDHRNSGIQDETIASRCWESYDYLSFCACDAARYHLVTLAVGPSEYSPTDRLSIFEFSLVPRAIG
jgi:hypothetical protein